MDNLGGGGGGGGVKKKGQVAINCNLWSSFYRI